MLFPAKAAATFIATERGRRADDDFVFDQSITRSVGDLLKLSARSSEPPESRLSGHSLRSGAASLFVSCVPLEDIRRFGRWRAVAFREYLWFGDLQYRHLGDLVGNSAGLTDQLRLAAGNTGEIRFFEPTFTDCGRRRTGGKETPLGMRWRSAGSSPQPRSGSESQSVNGRDRKPQELPGWKVLSTRSEDNRPGSVTLGYLSRPVREHPPSNDVCSKSQEKRFDGNFKAAG